MSESASESDYYSFDEGEVQNALEAARETHSGMQPQGSNEISMASVGELSVSAGCISVTVRNNRVCLNLPLGLGKICFRLPASVPNGTAAQACLSVCTIWGFPTGACVSIAIAGSQILRQCFGRC